MLTVLLNDVDSRAINERVIITDDVVRIQLSQYFDFL